MKKSVLFLSLFVAVASANAQMGITLTGTSYTETFDGQNKLFYLSDPSSVPGWHVYYNASSSSLGTYDDSGATSTYNYNDGNPGADPTYGCYQDTSYHSALIRTFSHGFKNSASNDGMGSSLPIADTNCWEQSALTNRCLAVRQSSAAGWDPGPAFCLHLNNTIGQNYFTASFNLQSLDAWCPRVTTWGIDYGFGLNPTVFTPVPASQITGTLTTGGLTFSDNAIHVNFETALDNMATDVWIRINALSASTGSGLRTTTGIDDFNMTWANFPEQVAGLNAAQNMELVALGNATPDNIVLKYNVAEAGNYTLAISDIAGRTIHSEFVNAVAGGQVATFNTLHLAPGMYIATLNNESTRAVARVSVQ